MTYKFPKTMLAIVGDVELAKEYAEVCDLDFEQTYAFQINPWVSMYNRGLGLPMDFSAKVEPRDDEHGDKRLDVSTIAASNSLFNLRKFHEAHGFYPKYMFKDNDRFYSEAGWWDFLGDEIREGRGSNFRATSLNDSSVARRRMAELAASWQANVIAGMGTASLEAKSGTRVASWAALDAKRIKNGVWFAHQNLGTIDQAQQCSDFITVNFYIEGWSDDLTDEQLYERARDATLCARLVARNKPVYITVRFTRAIKSEGYKLPAEMNKLDRIFAGAADGGAYGMMLWDERFPFVEGKPSHEAAAERMKLARQHFPEPPKLPRIVVDNSMLEAAAIATAMKGPAQQ